MRRQQSSHTVGQCASPRSIVYLSTNNLPFGRERQAGWSLKTIRFRTKLLKAAAGHKPAVGFSYVDG